MQTSEQGEDKTQVRQHDFAQCHRVRPDRGKTPRRLQIFEQQGLAASGEARRQQRRRRGNGGSFEHPQPFCLGCGCPLSALRYEKFGQHGLPTPTRTPHDAPSGQHPQNFQHLEPVVALTRFQIDRKIRGHGPPGARERRSRQDGRFSRSERPVDIGFQAHSRPSKKATMRATRFFS